MHELSLVDSIVSNVSALARQQNFKKVRQIRLEIGAMSGVVAESIEFCFPEVARGSVLEDASLVINNTPLKVRCQGCAAETTPEIYDILCGKCESRDVTVIGGQDFKIIDLEVE